MAEKPQDKPLSPADTADNVLEQWEDSMPQGNDSSASDEKGAAKPAPQQQKPPDGGEKKPSKLKQMWEKTGLDAMTLKMMFKGSLPPTIAIAAYQSKIWAAEYTTLGFLVAIASNLGFAIMPRGKFIQTMCLNILAVCLGAAVNLLALYCAVTAGNHARSPPAAAASGAPVYNSSQSAVCALWLIVNIYIINVVRASRPQYQFPCILASIFTVISLSYGTVFPDMAAAISYMENLLRTFLTGFAIATGVHFLVFPTSSRKIVFLQMTGYLKLLNGILKLQTAYMASLETFDPMAPKTNGVGESNEKHKKKAKREKKVEHADTNILLTPPAIKLKETLNKLLELHAKLYGDVTSAKREVAIGKLESHDITELWKLLRQVFLPVVGLSSMINVLERNAKSFGWDKTKEELTEEEDKTRHRHLDNLHFLMQHLHEPFAFMMGSLDGAFQHVLLTLEFVKPEKKQKQPDEESKGDEPAKPGTPGFAETFKQKVDEFYNSKQKTLQQWCKQHGIELPPDFFDSSFICPENISPGEENARERRQRQLFFVLYLEYLLWRCSDNMLNLILFVDKRKQEGAFKSSKVIFPGSKTIYKWIKATFGEEDFNHETSYTADMDAGGEQSVYLSQQWRRDPEHNPPETTLERIGDQFRKIPKLLRSDASAFGLRVSAATMTLGIVLYLKDTQSFFLRERGLWSLVMLAISMNRTSGQSVFQLVCRVAGTVIAVVGTYIIWYIVDGKTAGVIVFLWLWIFCAFYFVLKFPKMVIAAMLSLVTALLIIGYELQVRVIGLEASEATGQIAYPQYILAPYRLATVVVGIFVAFIWTVFPYPISETTTLRTDLAAGMFLLSAFYENVHETVQANVSGRAGDPSRKGSHAHNLSKARTALFGKLVIVLNNLKTNGEFSKYQLSIGGRFPREEYLALINTIRRLLLWTSLASFSSVSFQKPDDGDASLWSTAFREVLHNSNTQGRAIASLLSILSSSMSNGTPLPPYIKPPEPFQFLRRINETDTDILSVRHIAEPEYSAFAVMQIVSRMINEDLLEMRQHVKNLVGEIDFSYRAVKSSSLSTVSTTTDDSDDKSKDS